MKEEKIQRINELYHKSKEPGGLTKEEREEQKNLRKEYVQAVRNNLRGQLNQLTIINPDGSRKELKKLDPDGMGMQ